MFQSYFTDRLSIHFPLSPTVIIFIFRKDYKNYNKLKYATNRLIPINNMEMIDNINKFQWLMADNIFINPKCEYLIERYKTSEIMNYNLNII
jgi:hypothetical protein